MQHLGFLLYMCFLEGSPHVAKRVPNIEICLCDLSVDVDPAICGRQLPGTNHPRRRQKSKEQKRGPLCNWTVLLCCLPLFISISSESLRISLVLCCCSHLFDVALVVSFLDYCFLLFFVCPFLSACFLLLPLSFFAFPFFSRGRDGRVMRSNSMFQVASDQADDR